MLKILPWLKAQIDFDGCERFASLARFNFDICLIDIFLPFYLGKTLYIMPERELIFTNEVPKYLEAHKINFIQTPPSIIKDLKDCHSLKVIVTTAEPMPVRLFDRIDRCIKIYNLYGQTQANSYLIHRILNNNELNCVGSFKNSYNQCEIIDKILYVKGDSLYLGAPKWYCTNDYIEEKDELNFIIGRADNKFKINGRFIDLFEFEKYFSNKYKNDILAIPFGDGITLVCEDHLDIEEKTYLNTKVTLKRMNIKRKSNGKTDYQALISKFTTN
jgi:acyl-coenzyme A synthetase/AMP-(fatty) acid ligase